jgi:RNA polymerase sigma-70 factor, ECF subfamily
MDENDHVLWRRVQIDDADAFEILFERYANDVYNFCFRSTASWSRAEDLVSEVFLEAWRKRAEFDLTSSDLTLRPLLIGVAHNKIRNESRRRLRAVGLLGWLAQPQSPDSSERVLDRIDDEQRMTEIHEAVRKLPRSERDVLILYAWGDLGYQEVAHVLGVPVGTVRSRLSRARERIREARSRHEVDEDLRPKEQHT